MWIEQNNKLYKKFLFRDFLSAIAFMQKCGEIMHQMDHHADWKNLYNSVEVWLYTHSAGNIITKKDHELAAEMDKIYLTVS